MSPTVPALELVWSSAEPARIGELFCLPRAVDMPFTIGRAVEPDEEGALPLVLQQLRPCSRVETGALLDARVSRRHVGVRLLADGGLLIERLGRGEVSINGHQVERAIAEPGDIIEAVDRFAVLYTTRPASWPESDAWARPFPFGEADRDGLVGESPAIWALRRQIAAVGPLREHVLVHGPSGTGKELVVRALHVASGRGSVALVARNAATMPESLIDAELFGNLRDYPNFGVPDRVGLLGEADHGALYLDELGELPHALQSRLMRVMDSGEYQRLGEARRRTCDLRIYGATNSDPAALKHDLLARFIHRIDVPGLDECRGDIPLLARHILRLVAREHPELRARFFSAEGEPRLAPEFVAAVMGHSYAGHVRELIALLWRGLNESPGPLIGAAPGTMPGPAPRLLERHTLPEELTREQIVATLAECDGVREQAWRNLGLQSRHQLKRLLKKFDIA